MRKRGWRTAAKGLLVAALAVAGLPQAAQAKEREGVEPAIGVPFAVRRGFYLETQMGVFTAFGGSKTLSNAQPYVAFSLGWDLSSTTQGLTLFLTGALGANAASCRDFGTGGSAGIDYDPDSLCRFYTTGADKVKTGASPRDFNVIPVELGLRYAFGELASAPLNPYLSVGGGYTVMTPAVALDAPLGSPHAGAALGLEYQTRLEGLTVGAEVSFRFAFSPALPYLTAYPRVRYVF